jgi:hypothetical protein
MDCVDDMIEEGASGNEIPNKLGIADHLNDKFNEI